MINPKDFSPTESLIKAVKNALMCELEVTQIEPIVNGYKSDWLISNGKVAQKWIDLHKKRNPNKKHDFEIHKPENAYLMDEKLSKVYYTYCDQKAAENGFELPEGWCPLSVANNNLRDAMTEVVKESEYFTSVKHDELYVKLLITKAKEFEQLLMKLVISHSPDLFQSDSMMNERYRQPSK